MKYSFLPDEFDMNFVSVAIEFVRTKTVADPRGAAVAVLNVEGYAFATFGPKGPPVIVTAMSDDETIVALEAIRNGAAGVAAAALPWGLILAILIPLLKKLFPNLPFAPA